MSTIDIRQPHSMTPAQARKSVEALAEKLATKFGVGYDWDGDGLVFERSGVDGRVDLEPGALRVTAKLGFMLSAMKAPIEQEIRKILQERFA